MNGMAELARAIVGGGYKPRSSEHLATVVRQGRDGTYWVRIPGGAEETPITTPMVEASEGDTVRVTISGGRSVMTGNVTSPSANVRTVTKVGGIANMALTTAYSESARIDRLAATSLTADSALITDLQAETAKVSEISADALSSAVGYIGELEAGGITAEEVAASAGAFDNLDAMFAEIDFANVNVADIGKAKISELFAESGLFEDLTVTGDGIITGRLTASLLDGDTARFSNIYADALKLLGPDGLYHALNIAGLPSQQAQALIDEYGEDLEGGLHGSRIIAESITADQIDVTSLVAAMLLAQTVQIGSSAGTHIEGRGDRFSFFASGYGWETMPDEYLYRPVTSPYGSPVSNGWYELVDGRYTLTSDTTVVAGKTYYEYIVTPSSALPGEVAYIAVDPDTNESTFYMTRSVVVKDLRFGNWMWYGRDNRNMSLKWIG